MDDVAGQGLTWGRTDDGPALSVTWTDRLEVVANDGTTIVGHGWDLHPRTRWEAGSDWAIADVVWGAPSDTTFLERPAFQPGQVLALKLGRPGDSGSVAIWEATETTRVGFVPEPHAKDVTERLNKHLPIYSICTWQWRDLSNNPRTIRCLYATALPEFNTLDASTPNVLGQLPPAARGELLQVLTSPSEVRADLMQQFQDRGEEDMVQLLAELEADEPLRLQVIDLLRRASNA